MICPANPDDLYFGGGGVTPPTPPLKFRPCMYISVYDTCVSDLCMLLLCI